MGTSLARQIKRLTEQLEEAKAIELEKSKQVGNLTMELKEGAKRERVMRDEIAHERLLRVSAQRGLVAYINQLPCPGCGRRLHELGVRIGYDPDQDPKVIQEITEGKIPPHRSLLDLREIVHEVMAGRVVD